MVEMGCTLGFAFTLGDGGVPGVAVGTLGDQCIIDRVQQVRSVVAIGAFVSPAQCSIVPWRALLAWSCASTVDASVF